MTTLFNGSIFTGRRRVLRKNMTRAEILLWSRLRRKQLNGCRFRRQFGIGKYVVDFYCPELSLAIEVDGDVHGESEQARLDVIRQREIESLGIRLLRYSNHDIYQNIDGVLSDIFRTTPLSPPYQGGDSGEVSI